MLHRLPRRAAALLAALTLAACSSSPAMNGADAAPEDARPDAATPDATPTPDTPATPDAPAGDGGACEDFSGAYTLVGTCSVPGFSPFPSACIAQTGCNAQIVVATGPTTGTVAGNTLTFTSMVSGIPLACTATRVAGGALMVRCEAGGGAATCEAMGTPAAFPGATRWCCDLGAQDCGAGQRCNIVGAGTNNAVALTACIPAGTLTEGAVCTRTDGRPGADTCATGLSCILSGDMAGGVRTCQRVCRSGADCMGAACVSFSDAPRGGVCRATCTPFGTDCGAGTCRYVNTWAAEMRDTAPALIASTCQAAGMGMEGTMCTSSGDCAANHTCARRNGAEPFACRRICDMKNACLMGTTCSGMMSANNPTASGYCFPS
jgi:hypothetical protein